MKQHKMDFRKKILWNLSHQFNPGVNDFDGRVDQVLEGRRRQERLFRIDMKVQLFHLNICGENKLMKMEIK